MRRSFHAYKADLTDSLHPSISDVLSQFLRKGVRELALLTQILGEMDPIKLTNPNTTNRTPLSITRLYWAPPFINLSIYTLFETSYLQRDETHEPDTRSLVWLRE